MKDVNLSFFALANLLFRARNIIYVAFFPNSTKAPLFYYSAYFWLDILVTVAQVVVRPLGREEIAGSNPAWSLKFLWRKISRCLAGILLIYFYPNLPFEFRLSQFDCIPQ